MAVRGDFTFSKLGTPAWVEIFAAGPAFLTIKQMSVGATALINDHADEDGSEAINSTYVGDGGPQTEAKPMYIKVTNGTVKITVDPEGV